MVKYNEEISYYIITHARKVLKTKNVEELTFLRDMIKNNLDQIDTLRLCKIIKILKGYCGIVGTKEYSLPQDIKLIVLGTAWVSQIKQGSNADSIKSIVRAEIDKREKVSKAKQK